MAARLTSRSVRRAWFTSAARRLRYTRGMASAEHAGIPTSAPGVARLGAPTARRVTVVALAVVAVALVAFFGWSEWGHSGATPATNTASVSGVVVREGGPVLQPPGGVPQGYAPLVVTGTTTAGIRLVRHLSTDGHGRFALKLPPGVYTVTARIFGPPTRALASEPHAKVTVRRGQPVHVHITGYVI
jgi:hypothetical protein